MNDSKKNQPKTIKPSEADAAYEAGAVLVEAKPPRRTLDVTSWRVTRARRVGLGHHRQHDFRVGDILRVSAFGLEQIERLRSELRLVPHIEVSADAPAHEAVGDHVVAYRLTNTTRFSDASGTLISLPPGALLRRGHYLADTLRRIRAAGGKLIALTEADATDVELDDVE